MNRNVWTYWSGKKPDLMKKLFQKMKKHSNDGKNYILIKLTDQNIGNYIEVPKYFHRLEPVHKADYIRIKIIKKYGGIWLDADTIVLNDLSGLFKYLDDRKGFFIIQQNLNDTGLSGRIFGSLPNTELMIEWNNRMESILEEKAAKNSEMIRLGWSEIVSKQLTNIGKEKIQLYDGYKIIDGNKKYFLIPYTENYKYFTNNDEMFNNIIKKKHDIVIITNMVYRFWEVLKDEDFIKKTLIGKLVYH